MPSALEPLYNASNYRQPVIVRVVRRGLEAGRSQGWLRFQRRCRRIHRRRCLFLRGVKGPDVGTLETFHSKKVPSSDGSLEPSPSLSRQPFRSDRTTVSKRTVISVGGVGVVIAVPVAVRVLVLRCKVGKRSPLLALGSSPVAQQSTPWLSPKPSHRCQACFQLE